MFDRSPKNQKFRVPEYTFSLLPLSLVHFGFCTNLVGFRFSSLNNLFARTVLSGSATLCHTNVPRCVPTSFRDVYCTQALLHSCAGGVPRMKDRQRRALIALRVPLATTLQMELAPCHSRYLHCELGLANRELSGISPVPPLSPNYHSG